ncbi:MAG: ribonuclease HI family protein [Candidatus Marsarchaeota archaeon]|jgi:ribonuclease HI|nr:ribonuclease HI family protein [Candidatus Marsarchaeota archaeon]
MEIIIYTDGASRGNPGKSASGFAVYEGEKLIKEDVLYNNIATNNYAEYKAVIGALTWCKNNLKNIQEVNCTVYSDSQLVVNQLNRAYKVKSERILELYRKVNEIAKDFKGIKFVNVRRSDPKIERVDKNINLFLDDRIN